LPRKKKQEEDTSASARQLWAVLAWSITLLFFLPVAWMVLTSLHQEADAATNPPSVFAPITFSNYADVFDRGVLPFLINSGTASLV
jgi:sorbitol/mannitol transport system permease protein